MAKKPEELLRLGLDVKDVLYTFESLPHPRDKYGKIAVITILGTVPRGGLEEKLSGVPEEEKADVERRLFHHFTSYGLFHVDIKYAEGLK